MNIDQVMTIYRATVDPTATAAEGMDWWREVQAEVVAVIAAPTNAAVAAVIVWWKSEHEWAQCRDTPARVAGRIRQVAKSCFEITGKTNMEYTRPGGRPKRAGSPSKKVTTCIP